LEDDDDSNCGEDINDNDNPFDGITSYMVIGEDNQKPLEASYPELLNLCTILNLHSGK
jgi:hypothetical protein